MGNNPKNGFIGESLAIHKKTPKRSPIRLKIRRSALKKNEEAEKKKRRKKRKKSAKNEGENKRGKAEQLAVESDLRKNLLEEEKERVELENAKKKEVGFGY